MQPAVKHHDDLAAGWEDKYRAGSFAERERVFATCLDGLDVRSQDWLDAGCGTGRLARLLAKRGAAVVGVDASPEMLAAAERAAGAEDIPELTFRHVDTVEHLPFGDGSLDGVLCSSVIEYLDDPAGCLDEFARVLRPGGVLLISAPNRHALVRRLQKLVFRGSRALGRKPWPAYLEFSRNEYSRAEFARLLEGRGFRVRTAVPFGGPLPGGLRRSTLGGSLLLALAAKQ